MQNSPGNKSNILYTLTTFFQHTVVILRYSAFNISDSASKHLLLLQFYSDISAVKELRRVSIGIYMYTFSNCCM